MSRIPINKITRPKFLLRKVDRRSVEFHELSESLRDHGQIKSVLLRPHPTKKDHYQTVDGWTTVNAAKDAGLKTVKATVEKLSDEEALVRTIAGNAIRIDTDPQDFAKALNQILKRNPGLTIGALASMLHKDRSWIGKILRLPDLCPRAKTALSKGQMCLSNACELAKVAEHKHQKLLVPQALELGVMQFRAVVSNAIREAKTKTVAKNRGYYDQYEKEMRPSLRKPSDVRSEMRDPLWGRLIIADENISDPVIAWQRACEYMMNVDQYAYKRRTAKLNAKGLKKIARSERREEIINQKLKRNKSNGKSKSKS